MISMHIAYGRGLVLLWQHCNTLSTSGFVDDVIFSHNGKAQATIFCSSTKASHLTLSASLKPCHSFTDSLQVGPKKRGDRLITIILSNLNRLKKFFTGRFRSKFVIKRVLKIPSHLAYVATLPCETSMSAKQTINKPHHTLNMYCITL